MRISEKQLYVLMTTLCDTLRTRDCAELFTYDGVVRQELYDTVIAQQSDELCGVNDPDEYEPLTYESA